MAHELISEYHYKIFSLQSLLTFFLILILLPAEIFGKTFIDELGRKASIASEPKRIVSMAPNITEILFSLGLEDKIVGVTDYCNYPAGALKKTRIGGFINPSLEKIIALKPDIIISTADGNRKETVMQIEKIGLPVYVVNPVNIEGTLKSILNIGEITGRKDEAKQVVSQLRKKQRRIISTTKKLSKPKVFFQVGIEPIITVGGDTLINELISVAGGLNIYSHEAIRYPRCSIEDIISKNPAIIIVSSAGKIADYKRAKQYWQQWKQLQAVQHGDIHWIDPDIINRPSPRIMDALEQLTVILHPEVQQKRLKGLY